MNFDWKCYDLADTFLGDEPELNTTLNRIALAQDIQATIESFIQFARTTGIEPRRTVRVK